MHGRLKRRDVRSWRKVVSGPETVAGIVRIQSNLTRRPHGTMYTHD